MTKHLILCAIAFASLAAFARTANLYTESRLQICAFWGLAIFFEVEVRPMLKLTPSLLGFALNACAASAAIIAVKVTLEGLPRWHG